jgi:predicted DNA-binding transcriptional regulator AlpA
MTALISPRTLTEFEAARYIGMSRSWLAQARMTGDAKAPPFLKIGRAVRYLRSDLDNWLEQRRRQCTLAG